MAINPGVGDGGVAWMNSLTPEQQAQYAGGADKLALYKTLGNGTGTPMTDAQLAQTLGSNYQGEQDIANIDPLQKEYGQAQQAFTAHNQDYGTTGYQGNPDQVASQVANHAQSNSIPLGVLGSSFYQGGSDYGGQQTDQNSMSGLNGARDWTNSMYGVDPNAATAANRDALSSAQSAFTGRAPSTMPAAPAAPASTSAAGTTPTQPAVQQQAQQTAPQSSAGWGGTSSQPAAAPAGGYQYASQESDGGQQGGQQAGGWTGWRQRNLSQGPNATARAGLNSIYG